MAPAPAAPARRRASPAPSSRMIPFDYSFQFDLRGAAGATQVRKVVVSSEGPFTAMSVGYGIAPQNPVVSFGPSPADFPPLLALGPGFPATLRAVTVSHLMTALGRVQGGAAAEVLRSGFRLNPEFAEQALLNNGNAPVSQAVMENLFQVFLPPPEQLQFLYALFDDGSGRAFQSDPILNIAGLGDPAGERPFRYFAQPITFDPLATIRMEITEVSTIPGQLFVSLHGYKVLGLAGTPTGRALRRGRRRR